LAKKVSSLFGPLLPAGFLVALLALTAAQINSYGRIVSATITERHGADFSVFYASSTRAAHGLDPYSAITAGAYQPPNLNPPQLVLLLIPLTWVNLRSALVIWAAASLCSASIAVWIVCSTLGVRLTVRRAVWVFVACVWAAPTGALLYFAQIAWLLSGPITWSWAAARRGQWDRAAIVLGVLMSVKPFLALLVPLLLCAEHWRPALISAATALVSLLVGIGALGWDTFVSWLRVIRTVTWADVIFNGSLLGFFDRLFTRNPRHVWGLAPIVDAPGAVTALWLLTSVAIAGVSMWAVHKHTESERGAAAVDHLFGVGLSASLLITPLGWLYYVFFLVGPFTARWSTVAWRATPSWRKILAVFVTICFVAPPGVLARYQPNGWATLSIGSAYFWGFLGLWLYAITTTVARDTCTPKAGDQPDPIDANISNQHRPIVFETRVLDRTPLGSPPDRLTFAQPHAQPHSVVSLPSNEWAGPRHIFQYLDS